MAVARPPPLITELWVYLLFRWPTDKSASSSHRAACYESETDNKLRSVFVFVFVFIIINTIHLVFVTAP